MIVEVFKDVASIVGCVLSCITLVTLICKPIRNRLVAWIQKTNKTPETEMSIQLLKDAIQEHLDESREFKQKINDDLTYMNQEIKKINDNEILVLRDRILEKCLIYKHRGYIHEWERESLTDMHNLYISKGGNSYEHIVYDEAMSLKSGDVE